MMESARSRETPLQFPDPKPIPPPLAADPESAAVVLVWGDPTALPDPNPIPSSNRGAVVEGSAATVGEAPEQAADPTRTAPIAATVRRVSGRMIVENSISKVGS